jgi:hypothetical protein
MNKTGLAFSAALMILTAGAAVASPITGTAVSGLPAGVSDVFNIFYNGSHVGGMTITQAGEAACADPVAGLGGCSFSAEGVTIGGVTISPNVGMSNLVAVFYEPDGVTVSEVFAIGCESGPRDPATGKCTGTANFSVITPDPAHPFDFSLLSSIGMSVGFTGSEIDGAAATSFPLLNYIGVNTTDHGPIFVNLVSANEVPEPVTFSVFGAGLAGAFAMRRRKQK